MIFEIRFLYTNETFIHNFLTKLMMNLLSSLNTITLTGNIISNEIIFLFLCGRSKLKRYDTPYEVE